MKYLFAIILISLLSSCTQNDLKLTQGSWHIGLQIQDNKTLPFIAVADENGALIIQNATERILVDEITIDGDSITIQVPVFEGIFKGVLQENAKQIKGMFIKPSLNRVVPFVMNYGESDRFMPVKTTEQLSNISGKWEAVFSPQNPEDRYIAKGIFEQAGGRIIGTFQTTTGDYRYLEGILQGDLMKLSAFDGAHAFLFEAKVTDSTMQGMFYSGNHWKEPFIAKRNENYNLPDATTLTHLKDGYDRFTFSFPDTKKKMVSLDDERFQNKVVIVQLMGTWCPNCMDETKYYVEYLANHPNIPLEIVALAFEYAPTPEKAFASIRRFQNHLDVPYPVLLAQSGSTDKARAQEKLPMLDHVLSYPTSIFVDKKGTVRRIHTGFNGPATGKKHVKFKKDFEAFINQLLLE